MARAQNTDFFHNFKFNVFTDASAAIMPVAEGGFSTCSLPEVSLDVNEYKEGIHVYKRKFPGNPTVSDVSLAHGVTKTRSSLFGWMQACVNGKEYRTNVYVQHFHRDDTINFGDPEAFTANATASRTVKLVNAFCIRYKPGSDFDAQGSEVSIEECDIACESFEVLQGTTPIGAVSISN